AGIGRSMGTGSPDDAGASAAAACTGARSPPGTAPSTAARAASASLAAVVALRTCAKPPSVRSPPFRGPRAVGRPSGSTLAAGPAAIGIMRDSPLERQRFHQDLVGHGDGP